MNNSEFKIRGELAYRLLLNYNMLESYRYRPEYIFTADQAGWDGDWEGRTILALVRLYESTKREPAFLERIIDALEEQINSKGYLGEILPEGEFSEQQLSGHNWLLSGLIEYYLINGDKRILGRINAIIDNLYMKARSHYSEYPVNRDNKNEKGGFCGNNDGRIGCWHISTDIGCAFICMDALSKACLEMKRRDLLPLLTEMYEVFSKIDYVGLQMQTHATLSATRGIIRLYKITGEEKYLNTAVHIFDLYTNEGMTENYANINWFGRPLWTEPCAIIDSAICAVELYKLTQNRKYLTWYHKIYLNAVGYSQRPNGGFGLDVCVGYGGDYIRPKGEDMCVAYWCCTMRGSDGLSYFAENQILKTENRLEVVYFNDGLYKFGNITVTEKTLYPYDGKVNFLITNPDKEKIVFKVYIPDYADSVKVYVNDCITDIIKNNGFVSVDITETESSISVDFDIPLIAERASCAQYKDTHIKYSHGFLLLGTNNETDGALGKLHRLDNTNCSYANEDADIILNPLNDIFEMSVEDVEAEHRVILFENK